MTLAPSLLLSMPQLIDPNFHKSVVLLCEHGALRGREAIRQSAADLSHQLPRARFDYKTRLVDGEVGYLLWSAESDGLRVPEGADSYVIRNGRIVMQSIYYRLEPATHP